MRNCLICGDGWMFQQLIEYHEGRRAPLSGLAVEEEPAVMLWQAAVKVDEIIDDGGAGHSMSVAAKRL